MKSFSFIAFLMIAACSVCSAQNPVVDTHPTATIYAVDPQTGQEAIPQTDDAILFKDAFIDLVNNTAIARMAIAPGHKSLVITQMDPSGGNAYQLVLETKIFGQTTTIYTFSYNVDQNTLYYYDKNVQSWLPQTIQERNLANLNNCQNYGTFNEQGPAAPAVPAAMDQTANDQQQVSDGSDQVVYADSAPPVLKEYNQPECPADDYLWQPGYWAFSTAGGYYWVAGAWVAPPTPGLLWTPPYWGYEGGRYLFHTGYWGNDIGYYGGIYYGFGYGGSGFYGGAWHDGHFRYNTAVLRVNVRMRNTYVDRTVIRDNPRGRYSFNGPGGYNAKPSPREMQVAREKHVNDFSQNPRAVRNDNRPNNTHNNNMQHNTQPAVNGNNPRIQGNNNASRTNNFAPRNTNGNTPGVAGNNAPKGPGGNAPAVPTNTFGSRNTSGNAQGVQGNNVKGKQPVQTTRTRNTNNTKAPEQKNNDKKQQ